MPMEMAKKKGDGGEIGLGERSDSCDTASSAMAELRS